MLCIIWQMEWQLEKAMLNCRIERHRVQLRRYVLDVLITLHLSLKVSDVQVF